MNQKVFPMKKELKFAFQLVVTFNQVHLMLLSFFFRDTLDVDHPIECFQTHKKVHVDFTLYVHKNYTSKKTDSNND